MIVPFSFVIPPAPDVGGGAFDDAPDGADLAADSAAFRTSNDATAALRPAFNFHDISAESGAEIMALVNGDDLTAVYNILAFAFPYYGASKTSVRINTNGCVSFAGVNPSLPSLWTPGGGASNTLPHDDDPDDAIFPLMKDYQAHHVYAKEVTGPNRLIIQWDVWDIYEDVSTRHDIFQLVLHESGAIYFYYQTIDSDISGAQNTGTSSGVGYDVSPFIYGCQNAAHTLGVFIGGSASVANDPLVGVLLSEGMAIRIKPRT
jgi:hypothetical protein